MQTKDEIYADLCRQYVPKELLEKKNKTMEDLIEINIKYLLADIDSCTFYWNQVEAMK